MGLLASSTWILAHATAAVKDIYYREKTAGSTGQHPGTTAMTLYKNDIQSQNAFPEAWPDAALNELLDKGYIRRVDKDNTEPPKRYVFTEAGRNAAPGCRETVEQTTTRHPGPVGKLTKLLARREPAPAPARRDGRRPRTASERTITAGEPADVAAAPNFGEPNHGNAGQAQRPAGPELGTRLRATANSRVLQPAKCLLDGVEIDAEAPSNGGKRLTTGPKFRSLGSNDLVLRDIEGVADSEVTRHGRAGSECFRPRPPPLPKTEPLLCEYPPSSFRFP